MTFFESISTVFRKYADFTGHASRPEYWWFVLFSFITTAILGSLNLTSSDGTLALGTSLSSAWSLALLLPQLAVTVRRLRDTGRDWTNIFWILVPIAGVIVLVIYLSQPGLMHPLGTQPSTPSNGDHPSGT
ncbi:DUF805 domain-containing protein [Salinibacterium sp. TMP30]|uniref:DUF805 domain-containing protein n=1 Tax=Salinibacterium sp. TMP30 TaxID=3138237 RepID=UPI0031395007